MGECDNTLENNIDGNTLENNIDGSNLKENIDGSNFKEKDPINTIANNNNDDLSNYFEHTKYLEEDIFKMSLNSGSIVENTMVENEGVEKDSVLVENNLIKNDSVLANNNDRPVENNNSNLQLDNDIPLEKDNTVLKNTTNTHKNTTTTTINNTNTHKNTINNTTTHKNNTNTHKKTQSLKINTIYKTENRLIYIKDYEIQIFTDGIKKVIKTKKIKKVQGYKNYLFLKTKEDIKVLFFED